MQWWQKCHCPSVGSVGSLSGAQSRGAGPQHKPRGAGEEGAKQSQQGRGEGGEGWRRWAQSAPFRVLGPIMPACVSVAASDIRVNGAMSTPWSLTDPHLNPAPLLLVGKPA